MNFEEAVSVYDELVALCPDFPRKGKTMPHTSSNGYMFSMVNKAGRIGIRLPKESLENSERRIKLEPSKTMELSFANTF